MADNATVSCSLPYWYNSALEKLNSIAYHIMPMIYLISTVIPSFFVAIAFCRKYRKVASFIHQRIYICHIFVYGVAAMLYIFLLRRWGSTRSVDGTVTEVVWLRYNYALMWCTCHLIGSCLNVITLVSMMLLAWMAVDRLLAMMAPMLHRNMNHRVFLVCSTGLSYVIALSVNVSEVPRLIVVASNASVYSCQDDWEYAQKPTPMILSSVRNAVNVLITVCVFTFDTITVVYFLKRRRVAVETFGQSQTNGRERETKKIARTLLVLTISQSAFLLLGQPFVVAVYVISYFYHDVAVCNGTILVVFLEALAQLLHILQFLGLFVFNKPYSDLVIGLPFVRRFIKKSSET